MGQYVKKTMTGFKEFPPAEATHYIQTMEELKSAYLDKKRMQSELKDTLTSISLREAEISERYEQRERDLQLKYERQFFEGQNQIKELQEEIEKLVSAKTASDDLNRNLIRIMRERANANRKITPKAKRDGYVLRSIRQILDYQEKHNDWAEYNCQSPAYRKTHRYIAVERIPFIAWKLVIQTPFDIGLPLHSIESQILEELKGGILLDFGIPKESMSNAINKYFFQGNIKNSLWEIELYTTNPVVVPEKRRL